MNYKDLNDYEILNYVNESEEAIDLIYEKYKPLIIKIANEFYKKYCINLKIDINDLIQEGMIGLNSAISYYRDNKDTLFYTYAKTCIERRIISFIIGSNRKKHKILNESISIDSNYDNRSSSLENKLGDNLINPENIVISKENSEELFNELKHILNDEEFLILKLKLEGYSFKKIAEITNKDIKAIYNKIQRIRIKIKKNKKNI